MNVCSFLYSGVMCQWIERCTGNRKTNTNLLSVTPIWTQTKLLQMKSDSWLGAAQPGREKQKGLNDKNTPSPEGNGSVIVCSRAVMSIRFSVLIGIFRLKCETTGQLQQKKPKLFHMFIKMRRHADVGRPC